MRVCNGVFGDGDLSLRTTGRVKMFSLEIYRAVLQRLLCLGIV